MYGLDSHLGCPERPDPDLAAKLGAYEDHINPYQRAWDPVGIFRNLTFLICGEMEPMWSRGGAELLLDLI